jgi:protein PhnA
MCRFLACHDKPPHNSFPTTTVQYIMSHLPPCPACGSEYTYEDGSLLICPECAHEWTPGESQETDELTVQDANGNRLSDGDSITVIKDLKVKGSSSVVKVGTKVKNFRLVESDHNIDCKINGIGAIKLKSEFVKKS